MSSAWRDGDAGKARKVAALVLAGERGDSDEVARVTGVSCKALAPLAGTPMIVRVLDALQASARVGPVVLCGPEQAAVDSCAPLQDFINRDGITRIPAGADLGDSVQAGLATIDPGATVLITTADHALLNAGIINYFLDRTASLRADVSVGLVEYALVRSAYPEARRTALRFSEGDYCGCNLYALSGARARDIVSLWRRTAAERKRPWRLVLGLFGLRALVRYAGGRLGMEQARRTVLERTGISLDFVRLPFPHAGIDVDTPGDLRLVEKILKNL